MPQHRPNCPLCDLPVERESRVHDRARVTRIECARCGTYRLTTGARNILLSDDFYNRRHFFSAITRKAFDGGEAVELTPQNLESLYDALVVQLPVTPLAVLDRLLLYIAERTTSISTSVAVSGDDYPLYYQKNANDVNALVGMLYDLGRVVRVASQGNGWMVRLTHGGWERVGDLESTRVVSRQAFVAMYFHPSTETAWKKGIAPALKATGFTPFRVDHAEFTGKIDDRIIAEIRRSGLLVADFTGQRQGVYFEAGFAMGLGREVIWSCHADEIQDAHFDTRQYNHITWRTPSELRTRLINRIRATIPAAAPREGDDKNGTLVHLREDS